MKPWSHLPNAHHIDWVLESLKNNPELWDVALDAVDDAARAAARDAARAAARTAARTAAWEAARRAAWASTWLAAWDAARNSVWTVILALVVYDDCDQYLSMSYDELLIYAILSEQPQAVLLLPLKWVQEHECLVTTC